MPTLDASSPAANNPARGVWFALINVMHGIRHEFRSYRQRRRAYRELAALDAQALHDIGITRDDIAAVADGRFGHDPSRYRQHKLISFHDTAPPVPWLDRERPGIRSQSGQSALIR